MSKTHEDIVCLQLANAALVQGTSATAIVVFTNLENKDLYKLRYCIKWSDATGTEAFQIQVGITGGTPTPVIYPVFTKCADQVVTIGMLRRRELLCLKFVNPNSAAIVPHFVLLNDMHPQCIVTPDVVSE